MSSTDTEIVSHFVFGNMVVVVARTLVVIALLCAAVSGFVAPHPRGVAVRSTSSSRHMFNTDDDKKAAAAPLQKTDASPLQSIDEPLAEESTDVSNVVTDMNTGEVKEVKWIDPAMSANTNPFDMQWWAYLLFVIIPGTLLANDVAKSMGGGFLPTDGVMGFLGKI